MTPKDRCKLVLQTLQSELASAGLHLTLHNNQLISEDNASIALVALTPDKRSTAQTTRRFVEIAIRSKFLDSIFPPKKPVLPTSALYWNRVPPRSEPWSITDKESCIAAAKEIAAQTHTQWRSEIDPLRTEPAMLRHIAQCDINDTLGNYSNTPRRSPRQKPSEQSWAILGYFLHKLDMAKELQIWVDWAQNEYPLKVHPDAPLARCLRHVTQSPPGTQPHH